MDKALNYKDGDFYKKCKEIFAPSGSAADAGGWDVYFDNVGGDMLDFMLTRMKKGARVALCGEYSSTYFVVDADLYVSRYYFTV